MNQNLGGKMKKLLIAASALALATSAITFSAAPVPEKNANITIWETSGPEGQFIQYAAQQFEKQFAAYNVHIKYVPQFAATSVPKMETAVQTGAAAPDLIVFMSDRLGEALNAGIIAPDTVNPQIIQKNFLPAAVQAATGPDGKIYGFPLSVQTYALYYNKKYFPNGVTDFSQIMQFSKTFNNPANNQYALFFDVANFYYDAAFFQMYGANVFGMEGSKYDPNKLQINSPAGIKGIEALVSLKPASIGQVGTTTATNMMTMFGQGKIATMIDGSWDVQHAKDTGVNFGICPLPTLNGQHLISYSGIRLIGVNPNTKYPMASEIFAAFCTSPAMEKARFQIVGETPAITELADSPAIMNTEYAGAFSVQAKYSKPMPNISAMAAVWPPMAAAVADAWNGNTTVTNAMNNAQKVITQQIQMTSK